MTVLLQTEPVSVVQLPPNNVILGLAKVVALKVIVGLVVFATNVYHTSFLVLLAQLEAIEVLAVNVAPTRVPGVGVVQVKTELRVIAEPQRSFAWEIPASGNASMTQILTTAFNIAVGFMERVISGFY